MKPLRYKFDDFKMTNNNYILQLLLNKKLSEIYHTHDFYEIIIILKGQAIHKINSTDYRMYEGSGVLLVPGDEHCFKWQSADLELLGLSVSDAEFNMFYKSFDSDCRSIAENPTKPLFFSCESNTGEIKHMAMNYCKKLNNLLDCKLLLCFILHIFFDLHSQNDSTIPPRLEYAINNMSDPDNMKDGLNALLRLSNYSYPHLYRLFKEHYNQTPHSFILNLKLESAYSQILFSDLSIESIMLNLGYTSLSNFHSIFKKKYGISPGKLRKQNVFRKTF